MKSIVLKSLREPQPSNDSTSFSKFTSSSLLNLNPNLEFCIYSTCNLKSIKGFDFCYKHFKSFTGGGKGPDIPKLESQQCEAASTVAGNTLSEQEFLYKDLLRKEEYQANTNGNSSSEEDNDDGDVEMVERRRTRRTDYDYHLSHAAVYSRKEVVKIFKSKIEKLDGLYKRQLELINDNILISRKQFLKMRSTEQQTTSKAANSELTEQLLALKKYKKQSNLRVHLKKKFGKYSNQDSDTAACKYQDTLKCSNKVIPLSNYCLKHILTEPNQVLFFKCPGNPANEASNTCHRPLIDSIGLNCPIHVSNRFIDSKLNNIPDELIQSDNTTEDEAQSMHGDETESDRSTTDNLEEGDKQRMQLDSMINNVKLISVIKEEQLDQENVVI